MSMTRMFDNALSIWSGLRRKPRESASLCELGTSWNLQSATNDFRAWRRPRVAAKGGRVTKPRSIDGEIAGLGRVLPDHRALAAIGLITPHAGFLPVQQCSRKGYKANVSDSTVLPKRLPRLC